MNSRCRIKLNENSDGEKIIFNELPEEHMVLFCKYMDEAAHLRELDQLFKMMLFNLGNIFEYYDLRFNDCVYGKNNRGVDPIELNALVCNAVSSARTLIDSMEVFDKIFLPELNQFKSNYISKVYDDSFSYRIIDTLRNYMQHGHVPISFDIEHGQIYFDLSEILDIKHMKMNANLKGFLKEIEKQLLEYDEVTDTRINCVLTLYEYFLQVYNLYFEFYNYAEGSVMEFIDEIKSIVAAHPEYILDKREFSWVGVYVDDKDTVHAFPVPCDMDELYMQNKALALSEYSSYKENNGNLISLKVNYALENRIPILTHISEEDLAENLADLIFEKCDGVDFLSFDKYYGKTTLHTTNNMYPYIHYEDGMKWNVPYSEVTIKDFLNTFPEAKEQGIEVYANNVGGAEEIFDFIMQQWNSFFLIAHSAFQSVESVGVIDALDMIGRASIILNGYRWLKKSFSPKKEKKPTVHFMRQYIKSRERWNLSELADDLRAETDLMTLILKESGYVTTDGRNYYFDEAVAKRIEEEEQKELQKQYDDHGTDVNCHSMNLAVEQLNAELLYLAVLLLEQGRIDEFDASIRDCINTLEKYSDYVYWDQQSRSIRIAEMLPDDFDQDTEMKIWEQLTEIDEAVLRKCLQMEEV